MKYYTVPLNEVLEEMRKLLRHYTTREVETETSVDHCTVSRFLKGKSIHFEDLVFLHNFLREEEAKGNLQIKDEPK